MKRQALVLAALALGSCPLLCAQERSDKDLLQGTWVCVTAKEDGKDAPKYLGVRAVIDGDKITWHFPRKGAADRVQEGTYRLDPSKRPGHFDITYADDPKAVDLRLYTLAGDQLRWSANLDRKTRMTRPASFEEGRYQFTMKRVK